jgi:hypothetical protein
MAGHSRIGLAMILVIACAAGTPTAWAGLVTPDSIASPVFSWPEEGGPVPAGGLVTNQYQALGLLFPAQGLGEPGVAYSTAIIRLGINLDLFTGAYQATTPSGVVNHVSNQSPAGVTAAFVLPGTTTPDAADSVTVSLYSNGPILAQLEAFDKNGQLLKTITTQVGMASEKSIEFDIAGIQSVYTTAFQPIIDPPPPGVPYIAGQPGFIWGVSSIEWHEAPEPAGLVLGGLGMFIQLGYAWRRRSMRVRLGVRGA